MRKTVSLILLMVVVVAAGFFSMTPASGSGAGLWSSTGSMTEARNRFTLTLLDDGQVLAAGGYVLHTAELYDPAGGTWSSTADMTAARADYTATLLPDGRVLAAGGLGYSGNYLDSAELYNPADGTWSSAGNMTVARRNHTATLLADGRVLVVGGLDADGDYLASAELFDPDVAPADGPWSLTGSMAEARYGPTATLLSDGSGRVLVVGGGYAQESELASAELYDPSAGEFTSTGSMEERRGNHTAKLLANGTVLVAGGFNSIVKGPRTISNYLASAELYDPADGTWSTTDSMAMGRYLHTATMLDDGRVLVAGGQGGDGTLGNGELYDPADGTWATTSSMLVARYYHSAAPLAGGKVLVAGGGGYPALASAEVYDPAAVPETGNLTGTVTDADSGRNLSGVSVTVYETGQSAKTDNSGNYMINDVRAGGITVVAKKKRYWSQWESVTILNAETTEVNFALVHK